MSTSDQPEDGCQDAVEKLFLKLETLLKTKAILDQVTAAHAEVPHSLEASLRSLTNLVDKSLRSQSNAEHGKLLLAGLADASRDPALRRAFGPPTQTTEAAEGPTCILDVALKVLDSDDGPEIVTKDSLRLIGNCCAGESENRGYVVQKSGLSKMLALPTLHAVADFVVPALYNVCVDFEDVSEGVFEDSKSASRKTNTAEVQLSSFGVIGTRPSIEVLLGLSNEVKDDRKPFLADLVEMASNPAAQNLEYLTGETAQKDGREPRVLTEGQLPSTLRSLMISPGPELAAHSRECCVSLCNAAINILSQDAARRTFLTLDLLFSLVRLPYSFDDSKKAGAEDDEDCAEDLHQCRKAYLKLIYELTSMDEFQEQFTLESTSIRLCISALKERRPFSEYMCVILANVTDSMAAAEALVSKHKVHEAVISLLRQPEGNILPATGLLVKLVLPDANKTILVEGGIFEALLTVLDFQTSTDVQREVIVATRLLIKGRPANVVLLRSPLYSSGEERQLMSVILSNFSQSSDDSLKLEVGRLCVEVCRTSLKDSDGKTQLDQSLGENPDFARPISFLSLKGQGGARSEGWFGLAMLSVVEKGQAVVLRALEDRDLRTEMKKIATEHQGPSFENLRLMLAKLHPLLEKASDDLKADFEAAYRDAGLSTG